MEYIKSSQNWECDSHDSSKVLLKTYYPAVDEVMTKDSSKNKMINSSCNNMLKMGPAKKLLSAVEPSEELLNLLAKARDDLKKQEATKAEEIMAKEKLVEAEQSAFPDNFQVLADYIHQLDERERSGNKSVDNFFENALASKTTSFVECNQQKHEESLESYLQIDAVRVPFQAAKYYERKPFTPQWFQHDDRDREEVEEAAAKKFEGVNINSIKKSSCEAVSRWGHDLYDASQESQDDEFPGYSNQLSPRSISKCETVDRWGHDLYDAVKNDQEFSDFYCYDRRQVNSRGPNKYRSSFQEGAEFACSRPFRGRGEAARSQSRSEDRMNTKKDEISSINRDMKNFHL